MTDQDVRNHPTTVTRRAVVRTAAWSVPAISVASAAPAFAASPSCVADVPVPYSTRSWSNPWTNNLSNIHNYLRWDEVSMSGTAVPAEVNEDLIDEDRWGVYTGWLNTGLGDNTLIADPSNTSSGFTSGFTSGADVGSSGDVIQTVQYAFQVAAGAVYSLTSSVHTQINDVGAQHLTISYAGAGAGGMIAQITTSPPNQNPPEGHEHVNGSETRGAEIRPTDSGLLTISYEFYLDTVPTPWPGNYTQMLVYDRSDDITISEPVLIPTNCPT